MNIYSLDDIPAHLHEYFEPAPQIGLEETPAAYVAKMVEVFSEVWRVLRDDGVCWLNLGDSYFGGGGFSPDSPSTATSKSGKYGSKGALIPGRSQPVPGLKPKDLIGIPWRCAFALQDAGWYLRSDIIWHKPNPMPESVTDRPTKAHEYIFLLTKSERYFYDAEAIKEGNSPTSHTGGQYRNDWKGTQIKTIGATSGLQVGVPIPRNGRNRRSVWTVAEPMCRLRSDLTPEQRAYVLQRIAAEG
jgi:hypothetical protein